MFNLFIGNLFFFFTSHLTNNYKYYRLGGLVLTEWYGFMLNYGDSDKTTLNIVCKVLKNSN